MSIIERLERAECGSRELDAEIGKLLFPFTPEWDESTGWRTAREYTTSIDAALTLVPEGCSVHLHIMPREMGHKAEVWIGHEGLSKAPALALTIAALKAREKEGK